MKIGLGIGVGKNKSSALSWKSYWMQQLFGSGSPLLTDELDSLTGWAKSSNATIALNTSEKVSGDASIKLASGTSASNVNMTKTVNLSFDTGKLDSLRVWAYIHTPLAAIASMNIFVVCNDTTFNHYYSFYYDVKGMVANEWMQLGGQPMTVAAGSPNPNAVKLIRFHITRATSDPIEISFDKMTIGDSVQKAAIIRFDDGGATDYTLAYPYLKSKHMVATSYINSSTIGLAGAMTLAQIQELYNNKWDIGNHTALHNPDGVGVSEATYLADLRACETWLNNNGFTRSVKHVAYPNSSYTGNIPAAVAAFGTLTGWMGGGEGVYRPLLHEGYYYPLENPSYFPGYQEEVSAVQTYIDNCEKRGSLVSLAFHSLVIGTPIQYQYSYAGFCQIIDYLVSKGYKTLTVSEFYSLATESIRVKHW